MTGEGPAAADLPDPVRRQLIALVAAALPSVPDLPAPLRRVADFAPARRSRLGAAAILAALDSDQDFRGRAATQVSAAVDETAAGGPERVALLWLTRPEGWATEVADLAGEIEERAASSTVEKLENQVARMREQLERVERAAHEAQATERDQLERLRVENTTLRRRLGEARTAERLARTEADQARSEAEAARAEADGRVAAAEKELRQLRARLAELDEAAAGERRVARSERDEATVRARLLLDTLLEAGQGLRRELGLPAASGTPGDRVEAGLAPSAEGSAGTGVATPALLEQLLAMPRSRLIVDGYNVSKTAWPESTLEAQRARLLSALAPLVARTGAETTVVFDAAATGSRPVVPAPRGVKVVFSPQGVIADDVIRQLVAAEPPGRVVIVATSDRAVAVDVSRAGARPVSSEGLIALLGRGG